MAKVIQIACWGTNTAQYMVALDSDGYLWSRNDDGTWSAIESPVSEPLPATEQPAGAKAN